MKKLILCLTVILILSFSLSACKTSNSTFDIRMYETDPVNSEMIDAIKEYNENASSPKIPPYELFYEKSYVHYKADFGTEKDAKNVLDEISSGKKSINDYITKEWYIVVPGAEGIARYVSDQNGEYSCVNYSLGDNKEELTLLTPSFSNVIDPAQKTLSESNLKDIKSITYLYSLFYSTSFVYIVSESGEYLIPFSGISEITGLTNGKLYTIEDCFETIDENYGKDDTIVENKYFLITLIVFVITIVASVALIFFYRNKIRKKTDKVQ